MRSCPTWGQDLILADKNGRRIKRFTPPAAQPDPDARGQVQKTPQDAQEGQGLGGHSVLLRAATASSGPALIPWRRAAPYLRLRAKQCVVRDPFAGSAMALLRQGGFANVVRNRTANRHHGRSTGDGAQVTSSIASRH